MDDLKEIKSSILKIHTDVSQMTGRLDAVDNRLVRMEQTLDMFSNESIRQAKSIAALPCAEHTRRISSLNKKVDTNVITEAKAQQTWVAVKWTVTILIGLVGIGSTVIGIIKAVSVLIK